LKLGQSFSNQTKEPLTRDISDYVLISLDLLKSWSKPSNMYVWV